MERIYISHRSNYSINTHFSLIYPTDMYAYFTDFGDLGICSGKYTDLTILPTPSKSWSIRPLLLGPIFIWAPSLELPPSSLGAVQNNWLRPLGWLLCLRQVTLLFMKGSREKNRKNLSRSATSDTRPEKTTLVTNLKRKIFFCDNDSAHHSYKWQRQFE